MPKHGLRKRIEILERASPEAVTLESLIGFDDEGNMVLLTDKRIPLTLLDELLAE